MWIFYIILIIFFLLIILIGLMLLSKLEIEIKYFNYDTETIKDNETKNYLFYIRFKLIDKITWLNLKINDKKIKRLKESKLYLYELNKIKNKENRIIRKEYVKYLMDLNIHINRFNLYLSICALNNMLTSLSVSLISVFISMILAKKANYKEYSKDKFNYNVIPCYEQKLKIKIELSCIINIKIVHIINVIYMLIKKRSAVNNERTSNRRTYASFNE